MEKLIKTYSDGQPFYAGDMNTFSNKVNEIIDILNEGECIGSNWEIGNIVIYDNVDDKKIRCTADEFSLEIFPENRYTPIGIVVEVLEDGGAKIISLPLMSWQTPDEGTSNLNSNEIVKSKESIIEPYGAIGMYDETFEHVINVNRDGYAYFPTTVDTNTIVSRDSKRYYYSSTNMLPSPYNEDGSINEDFFIKEFEATLYGWVNNNNPNETILTNKPEMDSDTKMFKGSASYILRVENGEICDDDKNAILNGTETMNVSSYYQEIFTQRNDSLDLKRVYLLANGDASGKTNTINILEHQIDLYFDQQKEGGSDKVQEHEREGQYTAAYNVAMYLWSRTNNQTQKKYYLYTSNYNNYNNSNNGSTREKVAGNTEIWILSDSINSFVYDYGSLPAQGLEWIYVGTVDDGSVINGGVSGFLSKFTREAYGTMHCWYRMLGDTYYFLFTDDDENNITPNTTVWYIAQYTQYNNFYDNKFDSFRAYYGSKYYDLSGGKSFVKRGLIGDPQIIEGGVEGFLSNFTRNEKMLWRTTTPLLNFQISGHFPQAVTTWRFHTPGTEQGDWYLPSTGEWAIASSNYHDIQKSLRKLSNSDIQGYVVPFTSYPMSTSTMYSDSGDAYQVNPENGLITRSTYYQTRAFAIIPKLEN